MIERVKFDKIRYYIAIYLAYKVLLEIAYVQGVSYWYDYLGFVYEPNVIKAVVSYALSIVLLINLPKKLSIDGVLINTYFSICVMPILSFYWLANKATIHVVYVILFFLIFRYVSSLDRSKLRITVFRTSNKYKVALEILFVLYIVLCLYLGIGRGGIDTRAFSFSLIYELRSEGGDDGIWGYIASWCVKSFFPMFCIYFIYTKRYLKMLICLFLQIFMYLCYGFKAYLLSAIMTVVVYIIGKYCYERKKESNIWILSIFVIGLLPSLFTKAGGLFGALCFSLNNTFAMRMIFEPARIAFGYFEFFSAQNKLYFSEGLIGKLFGLNYPYGNEPIGFVLTRYMNGSSAVSNSNTGIVADSYAQLGVLGIILIPILAGLVILLIKKISRVLPNYFVIATLFYPVFMLNDNPLLTNILTNGWVIDIIMLVLLEGALTARRATLKRNIE